MAERVPFPRVQQEQQVVPRRAYHIPSGYSGRRFQRIARSSYALCERFGCESLTVDLKQDTSILFLEFGDQRPQSAFNPRRVRIVTRHRAKCSRSTTLGSGRASALRGWSIFAAGCATSVTPWDAKAQRTENLRGFRDHPRRSVRPKA